MVKLLLTDSGVRNASILAALADLLGKPIAEASALCIPTAGYGGPYGDPGGPWRFISGRSPSPMTELGWKSVGVLELTALPGIGEERWAARIKGPGYAMDAQTAVKVTGGSIEVVSEGHWKLLNQHHER